MCDALLALGPAVALYGVCTALRAERWRTLRHDPRRASFARDACRLVLVGHMGDDVLPARAGDLMRVVLMAPRADTTERFVVGTLLAERRVDVAVLVVLFLALAADRGRRLPGAATRTVLAALAVAGLVVAVAGCGVAGFGVLQRRGLIECELQAAGRRERNPHPAASTSS